MAQHDIIAQYKYKRESRPGAAAPLPLALFDLYTKIVPGTESYEWNFTRRIDNHSDTGDQVAGYGKGHKRARGQTWVDVREGMDFYPGIDSGPMYVDEIDYFGPRGRLTTGAASLCVVGRATDSPHRDPNDNGIAHLDAWFRLVPYYYDYGKVKLNHFIRAEMKCEKSIVSMQGGDRIQFSDDSAVPLAGFDPATGFFGLWRGRHCVAGIHVTTYETCVARDFPIDEGIIEYKGIQAPPFPLHRLIGVVLQREGGNMFFEWIKKVWGYMITILLFAVLAVLGWCTDLPNRPGVNPPAASQK